jgi:hypothetical protein
MVTGRGRPRISSVAVFGFCCGVSGETVRRNTDQRNPLLLDISGMSEPGTNEAADRSLHICPQCDSKLVQPVCWEQEGSRRQWRVWRRCPECEWAVEAVHDVVAIDAFDEQLDLGSQELADELRALEHANMREMAESFIQAMNTDLITADDFRV